MKKLILTTIFLSFSLVLTAQAGLLDAVRDTAAGVVNYAEELVDKAAETAKDLIGSTEQSIEDTVEQKAHEVEATIEPTTPTTPIVEPEKSGITEPEVVANPEAMPAH